MPHTSHAHLTDRRRVVMKKEKGKKIPLIYRGFKIVRVDSPSCPSSSSAIATLRSDRKKTTSKYNVSYGSRARIRLPRVRRAGRKEVPSFSPLFSEYVKVSSESLAKNWYLRYLKESKGTRESVAKLIVQHGKCCSIIRNRHPEINRAVKHDVYDAGRISVEPWDKPSRSALFEPCLNAVKTYATVGAITSDLLSQIVTSNAPSAENTAVLWNRSRVLWAECIDVMYDATYVKWRRSSEEYDSEETAFDVQRQHSSELIDDEMTSEIAEAARRVDESNEMKHVYEVVTARQSIVQLTKNRHSIFRFEEKRNGHERHVAPSVSHIVERPIVNPMVLVEGKSQHDDDEGVVEKNIGAKSNRLPEIANASSGLNEAVSSVESFIVEMRQQKSTADGEPCEYTHKRPSVFNLSSPTAVHRRESYRRRSLSSLPPAIGSMDKECAAMGFEGTRKTKKTKASHEEEEACKVFRRVANISSLSIFDEKNGGKKRKENVGKQSLSCATMLPFFQRLQPYWRERMSHMKRLKMLKKRREEFLFISRHLHEQVVHQQHVLEIATRHWEEHSLGAVFRTWKIYVKRKIRMRKLVDRWSMQRMRFNATTISRRRAASSSKRRWAIEAKKRAYRRRAEKLRIAKGKLTKRHRVNTELDACVVMAEDEEERTRKGAVDMMTDLASQNKLLDDVIGQFGTYVVLKREQLDADIEGHAAANALHLAAIAAFVAAKRASAFATVANAYVSKVSCRVRDLDGEDPDFVTVVERCCRFFRLSEATDERCREQIRKMLSRSCARLVSILRFYADRGEEGTIDEDCSSAHDHCSDRPVSEELKCLTSPKMSLRGLKRFLVDARLVAQRSDSSMLWSRVELLFRNVASKRTKDLKRPGVIGLSQLVELLIKLGHMLFYSVTLNRLIRETKEYHACLQDQCMEILGLKGLGIDDGDDDDAQKSAAGKKKKMSLREMGERVSLPPGLSSSSPQNLVIHALIQSLRKVFDVHVGAYGYCVDVESHRMRVFGNAHIKRVVMQHAHTLHRIYAAYASFDNRVAEKKRTAPRLTLDGLCWIIMDCTTTLDKRSQRSLHELLPVLACCRRVANGNESDEANNSNNNDDDDDECEGGFGFEEEGSEGNNKNKNHTIAFDFRGFVEVVISVAEYFESDPFVSLKTKLLLFFKHRLFSYCRMSGRDNTPAFDRHALESLFLDVEAQESREDVLSFEKYQALRVDLVKRDPFAIYCAPRNMKLKAAEEKLLDTIMQVALTKDAPIVSAEGTSERRQGLSKIENRAENKLAWRLKRDSGTVPPVGIGIWKGWREHGNEA
eukprot:g931.t1